MFSNKIVTFVANYPKQLFVVRCPTFLFSKLVRRLVEPSGYIDCEKCLSLKYIFGYLPYPRKKFLSFEWDVYLREVSGPLSLF